MRLRIVFIACLISLLPLYALGDMPTIVVKMPDCWKKTMVPSKALKQYKTLVFINHCHAQTPPAKLKMSAGELPPVFAHPRQLRTLVEKTGQKLLPLATEEHLAMQTLTGPQVNGFYYVLTDKTPKKNEYRYIAQGALNLNSQMLVVFTCVYDHGDEKALMTVLSMLKSIRTK